MEAGRAPYPEFPSGGVGLKGLYKERQYAWAFGYYDTMDIARDDKEARRALFLKNWSSMAAPIFVL